MSEKVLFNINNGVGVITLNAPKALNSLDTQMCIDMANQLENWRDSSDVKCILLKSSSEKAFCAGGDVVSLYKSMTSNGDYHKNFFQSEYKLDLMIHLYKKPIIALARGIVMGGGIGIMNGASHRVVTDTTKLAMPEITIGLFPDVGGSYFLNRMPGKAGLFLGLTGARFNGADALYTKMGDYFVNDSKLSELEDQLYQYEWTEDAHKDVNEIVEHFDHECRDKLPRSEVRDHQDIIDDLCNADSISEVKKNFEKHLETSEDKWMTRSLKTFLSGSPTSMAVIFEQVKRGAGKSIEEVFEIEGKMARNFGQSHDFPEGVRALLIDKDGKPNWQPPTLDAVASSDIDKYFV